MPSQDRTTVRLFGDQPTMMNVLKEKFNTNAADVMRIALTRLYEDVTNQSSEPSFVVEMHQIFSSWLGDYGFSHNLGSSLSNVTPDIGGIPLKYTFRRGEDS
tara:strand:+ start:201 stop:506 length:306 start_codon:yes stop_codon:yes gene_type:complete